MVTPSIPRRNKRKAGEMTTLPSRRKRQRGNGPLKVTVPKNPKNSKNTTGTQNTIIDGTFDIPNGRLKSCI